MENKKIVKKRSFIGEVVSAGMKKTLSVKVVSKKLHPKYKKKYLVSRKYHVHDEKETAKVGNSVRFVECRPLSKTKRWRVVEIVK